MLSRAEISSAEAFRQNIRRRIDELGISDAEAARRAGMAPSQLWRYLNGEREPDVSMLDRIAKAVGQRAHDLITPAE